MDDQRSARLAVPPPSLATPSSPHADGDTGRLDDLFPEADRAESPQRKNARRILELADLCLERRAAMDVFAEPYRLAGRTSQLALTPAFRELVTHFAAAFSDLVEAVDEAEHPNAHFHPASPLTRPLDWRALIADARLLEALEAGIAREQEHVRALAAARFHAGQDRPDPRDAE